MTIWFGKLLVDLVVDGAAGHPVSLLPTVAALAACGAIGRALAIVESNRQRLFAKRVEMHATQQFLAQVSTCDIGHFDDADWQNRLKSASEGLVSRPFQLAYSIIGLAGTVVTLVAMFGLIATLSPLLLLLAVASVVPLLTIQRAVTRRLYAFHFETTPDRRLSTYFNFLLSDVSSGLDLRAYQLSSHLLERHDKVRNAEYAREAKISRQSGRSAGLAALLSGAAIGVAYFIVAQKGTRGELTAGDLTALIAAIAAVSAQMNLLIATFAMLDQHASFLDDYFSFLSPTPLIALAPVPVPTRSGGRRGLRLENVSFRYLHSSVDALSDVTLSVAPGEMLAIVGINGSGKSTLVKLLLRFFEPSAGRITLDGVDLRDAEPADLRSRIGVLFQDFMHFQTTPRENVTLGRTDRLVESSQVLTAVVAARADSIVAGLPAGLDTPIGRILEGGRELSGGQWQRLALARLVYRDADVWVLDEPTAALDPEAEAAVFAELRASLTDKIGIVISHRFSTVRAADRIAVMEQGRLVELGTHDELVVAGGRYAQLFELQAAGYR